MPRYSQLSYAKERERMKGALFTKYTRVTDELEEQQEKLARQESRGAYTGRTEAKIEDLEEDKLALAMTMEQSFPESFDFDNEGNLIRASLSDVARRRFARGAMWSSLTDWAR